MDIIEDECPVCFEPMNQFTTTAYMGGCCKQELHLECLKLCKFRCPFCRYSDMELVDIHTATEHEEPERDVEMQQLIVPNHTASGRKQVVVNCTFVVLFTMINTFIIFMINNGCT